MTSRTVGRAVMITATVLVLRATPGLAQTAGEPIRLTGAALDPNTGRSGHVIIDITRWSTNAETDRLLRTLEEEGQPGLVTALQKNRRVGSVRMAGQLGYDLRYAAQSELPDGGREIVIGTDRRLSFAEIRNQPWSIHYPFIWIDIHLNDRGEGEGTMSTAAKLISAGGRHLVLENYDLMQPVRLTELKGEKLKR